MNSRRLEERIETPHAVCEWEPCDRVDVREMSDKDILAWVRASNKKAKAEMDYTRFRSVFVEDNW